MNKKVFLCFCIIFMCSCSAQTESDEPSLSFLFAAPLKEHAIWLEAKRGFDDACSELNIYCEWDGPIVIDTETMNQVIKSGIMKGVDAIITQGVIDPELVTLADEKGIPIFFVDSDIPSTNSFAYMGKDFNNQAKLLLEDIEKKFGKEEYLKIGIQVAEKDFTIAQDQIEEINKVFKNHIGDFEIVSISESKSDKVRAKREWSDVLSNHKDINVAINFAAESAEFCYEAAKDEGLEKSMLIYGVDDMDVTLNMISNKEIDGTVITSFYDYGYKSVKMLYDYKTKNKLPDQRVMAPRLLLLTEESIKDYEK